MKFEERKKRIFEKRKKENIDLVVECGSLKNQLRNVDYKIEEAKQPLKKEIGELKEYKTWINGLINNLENFLLKKDLGFTPDILDHIEKHGTLPKTHSHEYTR